MLTPQEAAKVKSFLNRKDEDLSPVFGALSDPKRCRIFRAFLKHKELCVSDIVKILGISMPSASQHLKILEKSALLSRERRGRQIYFMLNKQNPVVEAIVKAVA